MARPWFTLWCLSAVAALMVSSVQAQDASGSRPGLEVNTAQERDLDGLRGLGPSTTRKIMAARAQQPFADWADLMRRVPGLGPRSARQLSAQGLRVQGLALEPAEPTRHE